MSIRPYVRSATFALALAHGLAAALADSPRQRPADRDYPGRVAEPSATFGPPAPGAGYAIAGSVTLRRGPRPGSPVVARVRPDPLTNALEVRGVSGAFVRVRHDGIEGWASTREALPRTLALVLDARTGATVARVAVGSGQHDVVFSPDGARAIVYGFAPEHPFAAYEFRTSDFAPTRSIVATDGDGRRTEILAVFYGGRDRSVYAMVQDSTTQPSGIAVVRVHETGAPAEPPALRTSGTEVALSPDGRLAFVLRETAPGGDGGRVAGATIDVLDLAALAVRNTIELTGELADAFLGIEPSADGAELFLFGDVSRLRVVDAATGAETREVRTGWEPNRDLFLANLCSGGRSLLLVASGNPCEVTIPDGAWWVSGAKAVRAPVVADAVDTGAARFGVDGDGSRLVRFGAGGAAVPKAAIAQPDLRRTDQTFWSLSMTATPDGSRLVLFVTYGEVFCPC